MRRHQDSFERLKRAMTEKPAYEKCRIETTLVICPIAIEYSMGQIMKSVCVCLSVCVSVRLRALSRSHFFIDFRQNWHKRKNLEK